MKIEFFKSILQKPLSLAISGWFSFASALICSYIGMNTSWYIVLQVIYFITFLLGVSLWGAAIIIGIKQIVLSVDIGRSLTAILLSVLPLILIGFGFLLSSAMP